MAALPTGGGLQKHEGILEDDGYVHNLHCGDGFTGVEHVKTQWHTLNMQFTVCQLHFNKVDFLKYLGWGCLGR